MDADTKTTILGFQRNEITEYHVYRRLARVVKDEKNRDVLERIAEDELRHYKIWRELSGQEVRPSRWQIFFFTWVARLFGVTFGIKLMEAGESGAQHAYEKVMDTVKEAKQIAKEENDHEQELLAMYDEVLLRYTGSVVLGINDALVELTGALAGLTLALQDGKLIALVGSVTGIAAALSMGASEYLSTKTEGDEKGAVRAALYTGTAYLITVILLIMPFLLLMHAPFLALLCSLVIAICIIAAFNFYIAIAQDLPFGKRFMEMTVLSLSVAAISFGIGFVMRQAFGIE